jgi:hypothetical protein
MNINNCAMISVNDWQEFKFKSFEKILNLQKCLHCCISNHAKCTVCKLDYIDYGNAVKIKFWLKGMFNKSI